MLPGFISRKRKLIGCGPTETLTDWRLTTWMSEILEMKVTQMFLKVDFEPLQLKTKTDGNNDKSQLEIHQRKWTFN